MDLKEITERNYKATVKRGLITPDTNTSHFIGKIDEELIELDEVCYIDGVSDESELADIIIVCLNMAKHFNIDIQEALEEKTIYNETRKD